jgi:hypothetical protein
MMMTKQINITRKSPPVAAITNPIRGIARIIPNIAANIKKLSNK